MCQRSITTGLLSSPKHLITDLSGLKIRKLFHQCFTHILNSIWLIYYVCNCLSSLLLSHTRPFPFLNVNPTIKTIKNIISYSFSIRNRSTRESFSVFFRQNDTYYDKAKKCSCQKTIESIGWLDELEKQYDDPIAHFQKRVEQLKADKSRQCCCI